MTAGERPTADRMVLSQVAVLGSRICEVEAMVKALTSLLEPILISVMGAVVGFIVISLFLPLFNLIKLVRDMGK